MYIFGDEKLRLTASRQNIYKKVYLQKESKPIRVLKALRKALLLSEEGKM
jgi:hypothetical protein